jgi:hypothetical protein
MLAHQEVVQDRRYRRAIIAAVFVVAAISGFGIGRTTAETRHAPGEAIAGAPIPHLGPMSRSDRTRYEVYRKLNRIGPLHAGG